MINIFINIGVDDDVFLYFIFDKPKLNFFLFKGKFKNLLLIIDIKFVLDLTRKN